VLDEGPAEEGKGAVAAEVDSAMFVDMFEGFGYSSKQLVDVVRCIRSFSTATLHQPLPSSSSNSLARDEPDDSPEMSR
jgi:hypothetical protein